MVYGRNPRLPGVMYDEVPALEVVSSSEIVARIINTWLSGRRAMVEVEASKKVKLAPKSHVRPLRKQFDTGKKVYFKRLGRK